MGAQPEGTAVAVEDVVVDGVVVDGVVADGVVADGVDVEVELAGALDTVQQSPSGWVQTFSSHSIQTSVQPVSVE